MVLLAEPSRDRSARRREGVVRSLQVRDSARCGEGREGSAWQWIAPYAFQDALEATYD
jgi:hypothetical protein